MDIEVIKKNKKMIIYAIIAVLVVAVITAAVMLVISSSNNKTPSSSETAAKSIESLRAKAETARKANDKALAISLLAQAKQKLAEQPVSDTNTNAEVDVAAQQCLLGVKSACKGPQ